MYINKYKDYFFALGSSQNHLRQVQVNLIDTKTCNKPQAYNNTITPRMLCAGSLEGKRDACQVSGLTYNFLAKKVMLHRFLLTTYFEKNYRFTESCRDSTESSYVHLTQCPYW